MPTLVTKRLGLNYLAEEERSRKGARRPPCPSRGAEHQAKPRQGPDEGEGTRGQRGRGRRR